MLAFVDRAIIGTAVDVDALLSGKNQNKFNLLVVCGSCAASAAGRHG